MPEPYEDDEGNPLKKLLGVLGIGGAKPAAEDPTQSGIGTTVAPGAKAGKFDAFFDKLDPKTAEAAKSLYGLVQDRPKTPGPGMHNLNSGNVTGVVLGALSNAAYRTDRRMDPNSIPNHGINRVMDRHNTLQDRRLTEQQGEHDTGLGMAKDAYMLDVENKRRDARAKSMAGIYAGGRGAAKGGAPAETATGETYGAPVYKTPEAAQPRQMGGDGPDGGGTGVGTPEAPAQARAATRAPEQPAEEPRELPEYSKAREHHAFGDPRMGFHTRAAREMYERGAEAIITESGAPTTQVKNPDGSTSVKVMTLPEFEEQVRKFDAEQYKASMPYIAEKGATEGNVKRSFDKFKQVEEDAEGAGRAISELDVLDRAVVDLENNGFRTGPAQDWIATIGNWVNSTPGMDGTFDKNRIAQIEAVRKASINAATEIAKTISSRGATQFEFKTIQGAVSNAGMSPQGVKRISAVLRAAQESKLEEAKVAAQMMERNGGQLPFGWEQQRHKVMRAHDIKLGAELDKITQEYGGKTAGAGGAPTATAGTEEQLPPDQAKMAATRAEQLYKASIDPGTGKPTMTPQQAAAAARAEITAAKVPPKLGGPKPAPAAPVAPAAGRGGRPQSGFSMPDTGPGPRDLQARRRREEEALRNIRTMGRMQGPV